jgi:hypothetical protein
MGMTRRQIKWSFFYLGLAKIPSYLPVCLPVRESRIDTRNTFFIMRFGHASAQNGGSSISSLWLSIVLGAAAHIYILGLFKAKAWGQQHALSSS